MININNACYGCGICVIACKNSAISIQMSNNGFWIPKIDQEKCINCGICEKSCSFLCNDIVEKHDKVNISTYSFITGNEDTLSLVSSGGAAYEIASLLLNKGYTVVGVIYDYLNEMAIHAVIASQSELRKTIGSKYLQSYTVDAFKKINENEKNVFFGCPCYIDSLRRYARINNTEKNYIFIDFFCHGVPSYILWEKYLSFHLMKDESISELKFRDKYNGWGKFSMSIILTNGKKYSKTLKKNDYFMNIFLSNSVLNMPCYSCKFHGINSAADIRVGDLWGRKYNNNKTGVSGIIAFTSNGTEIIKSLSLAGSICEESIDTILEGQIVKNIAIPKNREQIFKVLKSDIYLPFFYFIFFSNRWVRNAIPDTKKKKIKKIWKK